MADIRARIGRSGKVTYQVRVRLTGSRTIVKTFKKLTDARDWARKTEGAVREGQSFPERSVLRRSLGEVIARYEEEILPQYGEKEQIERLGKLAWWKRQLGAERPLFEIGAADICECRARLAREGPRGRPASPSTQNRYLQVLKHVYSKAVREWEWATDNPVVRVQARQEPRGRVRFLSGEERERLLAACKVSPEPRLYPLVVVALGTGARRGELLGLSWRDVDLTRGRAIVQESKNGERRSLTLAGQALDVLGERARLRRVGVDPVFASAHGREAWFPERDWKEVLRKAKVHDFRFHDLRHTFASYLAMSGATLAELAEALGHKTLAMVKRYAHLSEQHTSQVVVRMTERFLS
jgi:integrase